MEDCSVEMIIQINSVILIDLTSLICLAENGAEIYEKFLIQRAVHVHSIAPVNKKMSAVKRIIRLTLMTICRHVGALNLQLMINVTSLNLDG